MLRFAVIIGFAALVTACDFQPEETPIARVVDEYLYASELVGIVAQGTLQADSIEAVQAYIHNWIQQKLLVNKAKRNLSSQQQNFAQEIENYRNSLIIFTYQNALVEQAVDTIVTETDIENYYEENKELFLLRNNIVRVRFAKLENYPESSRDREIREKIQKKQTIYGLIFSNELKGEEWRELADFCQEISPNFHLNSDAWIYFGDLLKEIPVEVYNPSERIYNEEDFLKRNRSFQVPDDDYVYYVNILEYRVKGNYSPIEFEYEKIRNIILNTRKIRLIESLRNEVMVEGQEKNWFEIY
jgi:hypothetical protein